MQDHYYQHSCRANRCDEESSERRLLAGTPTVTATGYRAAHTKIDELQFFDETVKEDGETMRATALLRDFGQSLWLDNITRDLLNNGTLEHYINDLSITGLTSNPTIFDHAVKNSTAYDAAILEGLRNGKAGAPLFFDLALQDITQSGGSFSSRS